MPSKPGSADITRATSGKATRVVGGFQCTSATGEATRGAERITYLQEQMKANSRHDLHLWTAVIVVALVLAIGLVGSVAPSLMSKTATLHIDARYLPQCSASI
jgi:hypothetical protein